MGVDTSSDVTDKLDFIGTYSYVYDSAIDEGKTEDQANELAMKAESDELGEYWEKYESAVVKIAEDIFSKHNLTLTEKIHPKKGKCYVISPTKNWKDSVYHVKETINGVGYFYFANIRKFLSSGPYTARQATLEHLHYLKRYPDVYGDTGIRSRLERELR